MIRIFLPKELRSHRLCQAVRIRGRTRTDGDRSIVRVNLRFLGERQCVRDSVVTSNSAASLQRELQMRLTRLPYAVLSIMNSLLDILIARDRQPPLLCSDRSNSARAARRWSSARFICG